MIVATEAIKTITLTPGKEKRQFLRGNRMVIKDVRTCVADFPEPDDLILQRNLASAWGMIVHPGGRVEYRRNICHVHFPRKARLNRAASPQEREAIGHLLDLAPNEAVLFMPVGAGAEAPRLAAESFYRDASDAVKGIGKLSYKERRAAEKKAEGLKKRGDILLGKVASL